jgi:hypothetical protein
MRSSLVLLLASSFMVLAAGCASDATTGPVASTPLAGRIRGDAFEGKMARATIETLDGRDRAKVEIFAVDFPCGTPGDLPMPMIMATVPWSAGAMREYASVDSDMRVGILTATSPEPVEAARAETLEAPLEASAIGKLRLRVRTSDGEEIEGEIAVQICE